MVKYYTKFTISYGTYGKYDTEHTVTQMNFPLVDAWCLTKIIINKECGPFPYTYSEINPVLVLDQTYWGVPKPIGRILNS